jgi:cytidylate kinase
MDEKGSSSLVVTIARAVGSGGSFVGKRLAARLGCRYLDREVLLEAARRLRRDPEALETFDERHLSFWERTRMAYAFGIPDAPYAPPPMATDDMELFETQKTIIEEAAQRGPAVIVGRAGYWILRGHPGHLAVFLHAPLEQRIRRVRKIYKLASESAALEMVQQSDRQREQFIRAATGQDWRDPANFHLCVDTARLGTPAAIELVYTAAMEVARGLTGGQGEERF